MRGALRACRCRGRDAACAARRAAAREEFYRSLYTVVSLFVMDEMCVQCVEAVALFDELPANKMIYVF